jgi:hypothetical protein
MSDDIHNFLAVDNLVFQDKKIEYFQFVYALISIFIVYLVRWMRNLT